jgi:hypothetical protein
MSDIDNRAFAALECVDSRASFLAFVDALRVELEESNRREAASPSSPYGPQPLGWENSTLPRFLDAMHRWGVDTIGREPDAASWRAFAELLWVGKIYE